MKLEKLKKLKDNRYELYFDNDIKLTFYDDIIVKYNLLSGNDFNQKFIDKLVEENDASYSYYQAIKFINKKLRSEKEIVNYLEKKEISKKNIADTVKKLKKGNFLNNKVYIKSYVNDQVNLSNKGYYKILRELRNLGFNDEEVLEYLNKIPDQVWQDKLNKLITKKIKLNSKYSGKKLLEKLEYDLMNLGYHKEMINNSLHEYTFNDNDLLLKEFTKLKVKLSKKYEGKELQFQIKNKLLLKGFIHDDINNLFE